MKFILIILLMFPASHAAAQTLVSGEIRSTGGEVIPLVFVSVTSVGPVDLFTVPDDTFADSNGHYSVEILSPGIYQLHVQSVFHETMRVPLLITGQEELKINIYPLPKYYTDGEYFHLDEHLEWVRAFGNFNNYDYTTGRIFSKNEDGSISAILPVIDDTLRYQVRTVTGGAAPLPQADFYSQREDGSFESVLILNSSELDSIEIRYDPQNPSPFTRYLPEKHNPRNIQLRGFISFENEADRYWTEPVIMTGMFMNTRILKNSDGSLPGKDLVIKSQTGNIRFNTKDNLHFKNREKIREIILSDKLNSYQKAAYGIAYVSQLFYEDQNVRFYNQVVSEDKQLDVITNPAFLEKLTGYIQPDHPLWINNPRSVNTLLELSGFSPPVLEYANNIVIQHPNDQVVRYAALGLIQYYAPTVDDIESLSVYHTILERYSDSHLARLARQEFQSNKQP